MPEKMTESKAELIKKQLMSSSGNSEAKHEMIRHTTTSGLKFIPAKKKATFELDAELHRWFKLHCTKMNITMAEKLEELLRDYKMEND